jgi:hypothetical protein
MNSIDSADQWLQMQCERRERGARNASAVEQLIDLRRSRVSYCHNRGAAVNFSLSVGPLVSLVAGILILIVPRLLNFIVAIYLIIMGLLGLFGPFRV